MVAIKKSVSFEATFAKIKGMKSQLQQWFRGRPVLMDRIKPFVRRMGYATPLQKELKRHLGHVEAFNAIQIGAHDGVTHDPFREYMIRPGWKSVVVEPNPSVFKILKKNYSTYPNIVPVNAAVGYESKELILWNFDEDFLATRPDSSILSTLVSFSPENMKRFVGEDKEALKHMKSFQIQCFTVEELVVRYGMTRLDALFVDVEGYENQILLRLDYTKLTPKLVVFENHLLEDRGAAIRQRLGKEGYRFQEVDMDTIASC